MNYKQQIAAIGGSGIFLLQAFGLVKSSIYKVESGHLAIKFNKFSGLSTQVHSEGWNFKIPYFERAIVFDVRQQPRTIECKTGSKDLQMVHVKMRVNIKPNPRKLPEIYRFLGMDYDGRVLPSVGNEVLKSVIARYSATQLINERDQVSAKVRDLLKERLDEFNIEIGELAISELKFGTEFAKSVEEKQIAQQMAERAKYLVDAAIQEKKSIIIKAAGEAKATRLFGIAMSQSPVFLELKRIEAAQKIATIIGRGQNRVFLESDTLLMNLTSGFNSNLEKKTVSEQNIEREIAHAKWIKADEKLQSLKQQQTKK